MIKQTLATGDVTNEEIRELKRNGQESNTAWSKRAYADLDLDDAKQWSFILLSGGRDVTAFRIRAAQSHLRGDMLPSFWSECALLKIDHADFPSSSLLDLPLFQPSNGGYAPKRNGLVEQPFTDLSGRETLPNLALLAIPVAQKTILAALANYRRARVTYNAVENILPWLAYVWGTGNASNPLMQQIGFPSAVMLNQIFATEGFDLAPGINASLSTPEMFWSGAKHWKDFYTKTRQNGALPKARFVVDHIYDIDEN